jgi:hypothetical protein
MHSPLAGSGIGSKQHPANDIGRPMIDDDIGKKRLMRVKRWIPRASAMGVH